MATSKEYLDYILEQFQMPGISYGRMMGEYILYYGGKILAYVCDNRLLVRPTPSALAMLPNAPREKPYEGGRDMLLVENTESTEFLQRLAESVYPELPERKKK